MDDLAPASRAFMESLGVATAAAPADPAERSGLQSVAWRFGAWLSTPRGSTFTIAAGDGGGCLTPAGTTVTETAGDVEITVLATTPGADVPCNGELVVHAYVVTLSQGLGSRRLVHASVDDADVAVLPDGAAG